MLKLRATLVLAPLTAKPFLHSHTLCLWTTSESQRSFNKNVSNTFCVPGTVLGTVERRINRAMVPVFQDLVVSGEADMQTHSTPATRKHGESSVEVRGRSSPCTGSPRENQEVAPALRSGPGFPSQRVVRGNLL